MSTSAAVLPARAAGLPQALARPALVGAALLWAGTFPASRVALAEVGPATLGVMRFLPAGLLLLLLAPAPAGEHPRLRRRAGLLGVVFFGVGMWLANQGMARTTAAHASLIVGSIPALTAGLAALALRERLSTRLAAAVVLSGVGTLLVAGDLRGGDPVGDFLVAASSAVAALYIVGQKHVLGERMSPMRLLGYAMGWGGLAQLPLAGLELVSHPLSLTAVGLVSCAYLAVAGSAAAHMLYSWGVARVAASEAGLYLNLEAAAGAVLSALLLGELLPPATLAGGVLMVAATLGASRSPASRSATRPGSPLPEGD